jgi:hypothetical protein
MLCHFVDFPLQSSIARATRFVARAFVSVLLQQLSCTACPAASLLLCSHTLHPFLIRPANICCFAPSIISPRLQRRAYKLQSWEDHEDFLAQLARSTGKLLKGGDPDLNTAARIVLYDWQRGKIPFYTLPPGYSELPPGAAAADGAAADAAAAAAEQMFSAAVTEDDAAAEAGARPENAAAAAQALRDAAAAALRKQRHSAIPTKEGYYMPDDEQGDGQGGSDDEIEQGSSSSDDGSDSEAGEGESEEVQSDDQDDQQQQQQQDSDDEPASEGGLSDDAAAAGGGKQKQQQQRRGKKQAAAAAADDSGDDSDGYGEAGLSWEAVLQAVQVGAASRAVLCIFALCSGSGWGQQLHIFKLVRVGVDSSIHRCGFCVLWCFLPGEDG